MQKKDNTVLFGASSVKITPPAGTLMAGYFTKRQAEGVHDDLYLKALFIQKSGRRALVLSCDLIGLDSATSLSLRRLVCEKTGMPVESVMVCSSHTHTGPVVRPGKPGWPVDPEYMEFLKESAVRAACSAADGACEGHVEYGTGQLPGYAFNRRYVMKNGSVMTNPGVDNPDVIRPAGLVDDSVNVLKFVREDGSAGAVLVNTGLHPDTVSGSKISADWPGYMCRRAGEKLAGAEVLFINGPQGDINHFDVMGKRVEQGIEEAVRIGSAYGDKVVEICRDTSPVSVDGIEAVSGVVKVPARRFSDEELDEARKVIEKYGQEHDPDKSGRILESQDIARGDISVKVLFARRLLGIYEKFGGKEIEVEVSALKIGEVALAGVGGELFTRVGLAIKRQSPFKATLVAVLTNGYIGYIPSEKEYREGSYEIMNTKFSVEVGDIVVKSVLDMLETLAKAK